VRSAVAGVRVGSRSADAAHCMSSQPAHQVVRDSLDGRVFCVRGALSFRCVFDARELDGAEYGLADCFPTAGSN